MISGVPVKDLIFVDESGVNLGLTRSHARSPKGERARGKLSSKKGKNVSIIGAIGLNRVITQLSLSGSTDGVAFEAFIAQKLVPNLWQGACVVLDNYSIHKGEEVKALIQAVGARLVYLPPYSPDFSPIENCWSKLKNILRSLRPRNYSDLLIAIEKAFSQVSWQDLHNWFTHCCYCS